MDPSSTVWRLTAPHAVLILCPSSATLVLFLFSIHTITRTKTACPCSFLSNPETWILKPQPRVGFTQILCVAVRFTSNAHASHTLFSISVEFVRINFFCLDFPFDSAIPWFDRGIACTPTSERKEHVKQGGSVKLKKAVVINNDKYSIGTKLFRGTGAGREGMGCRGI